MIANDPDKKKINEKMLNSIITTEKPTSHKFKDLTGMTFGNLHVDSFCGLNGRHAALYWCTCSCGNHVIVMGSCLTTHNTRSCGCEAAKLSSERMKNNASSQNGLSNSRLYNIYHNMKDRCYNLKNKRYYKYGGRGIIICDEWLNKENGFMNFYKWSMTNGYKDNLSIDRINNDGNYCPENCRWTNNKIQQNNSTLAHYIHLDRWVFSITIWAEIVGLEFITLSTRIRRGWSIEDAILTPANYKRGERKIILYIPPEYEIYNKYDEWVKKGKIKPVEETIFKDCPYIEHK